MMAATVPLCGVCLQPLSEGALAGVHPGCLPESAPVSGRIGMSPTTDELLLMRALEQPHTLEAGAMAWAAADAKVSEEAVAAGLHREVWLGLTPEAREGYRLKLLTHLREQALRSRITKERS